MYIIMIIITTAIIIKRVGVAAPNIPTYIDPYNQVCNHNAKQNSTIFL